MTEIEGRLIRAKDVKAYLPVSQSTINRLNKSGALRSAKVGRSRIVALTDIRKIGGIA